MDSDDNFMIYRRFGFLYSRLLLWKQDELRELEDGLDAIDGFDANESTFTQKCLKSRQKDSTRRGTEGRETRAGLLRIIEKKLFEYGM